MSQQSLIWPLGIITMVLLVIVMALSTPSTSPRAAPLQQVCEPGESGYPACATQTAEAGCSAGSSAYPTCATETARAQSSNTEETATRTPDAGDDNTGDNSNTTSNQQSNTTTPSTTQTVTRTPTEASLDEDDEPTNTPGPTREQANQTPTSTLLPDAEVLICVPGLPVFIEGRGPANTALLLYFNERAVGGTTTDAQGFYRIQLVVGEERSGDYPVEVQVRGTREVVATETCRVPGATPTPTEFAE